MNDVASRIINSNSPEPLIIAADVNKDAEYIIQKTIQHFGKLDILINCAGINIAKSFMQSDISDFDRIFQTNTRSIVVLTKLAVPYLEATKGNIINVSSIAGLVPLPNVPFYSMSKSALDQFTKCISTELGPKHIRVNSINPALIKTALFQSTGLSDDETKQLIDTFSQRYPVRRIGDVSDTSAAIEYLASDAASFITGTTLRIDGGAITAAAY